MFFIRFIIKELIQTERAYVDDLKICIEVKIIRYTHQLFTSKIIKSDVSNVESFSKPCSFEYIFLKSIKNLQRVFFFQDSAILLGPFLPWLESRIRLERFKRYIKSFVPYLINLLYLHRTFLHQCTVVLTYHVLYKNVNQPISSLVISNTSMNSIASKSHLKQDSLFHFIVMFSFHSTNLKI